jgi:hypothetical protein
MSDGQKGKLTDDGGELAENGEKLAENGEKLAENGGKMGEFGAKSVEFEAKTGEFGAKSVEIASKSPENPSKSLEIPSKTPFPTHEFLRSLRAVGDECRRAADACVFQPPVTCYRVAVATWQWHHSTQRIIAERLVPLPPCGRQY